MPWVRGSHLVQSNVRICIGKPMELLLIHRGEYFLINGCKANTLPGKYAIEILCIQWMFLLEYWN